MNESIVKRKRNRLGKLTRRAHVQARLNEDHADRNPAILDYLDMVHRMSTKEGMASKEIGFAALEALFEKRQQSKPRRGNAQSTKEMLKAILHNTEVLAEMQALIREQGHLLDQLASGAITVQGASVQHAQLQARRENVAALNVLEGASGYNNGLVIHSGDEDEEDDAWLES